MASRKVVQPHYTLIKLEQGFEQVTTNKSSNASYKPDLGVSCEPGLQFGIRGHWIAHKRISVASAGKRYFRS